ncbi:MAG TPA: outer membrane beta-barrel protein, partial [Bacteroidota bacterium]|nr:outer membrane beta-barrel protein [Bacteroidota bacterium]
MKKLHSTQAQGIIMKNIVPSLCFLLLLTAVPLEAQYSSNQSNQASIGIGPQLGLYKAQDADNMKLMGGVAIRLKLAQALGIEGSINYRQEDYANGAAKVKSWPVMATGLIYVLPVVYGAIGAGWYNSTIEYNIPANPVTGSAINVSSETTQKFGWHFGGGVELPVGTIGKLTGDIRY